MYYVRGPFRGFIEKGICVKHLWLQWDIVRQFQGQRNSLLGENVYKFKIVGKFY